MTIFEKAQKLYSAGTAFRSVNNPSSKHFHISLGRFKEWPNQEIIVYTTNTQFQSATIYKDGKWAEIIFNTYEIY